MRNVEYKAELRDIELARGICRTIGATPIGVLDQTDTYYRVADGRLKKRETAGEPTEYIFYHRPAQLGPKPSQFTIYTETEAKERFGTRPLPVWLTVRKTRELFIRGGVRIHLDRVEGQGTFLELEALVSRESDESAARRALDELRDAFRAVLGEPIAEGYADMIARDLDA